MKPARKYISLLPGLAGAATGAVIAFALRGSSSSLLAGAPFLIAAGLSVLLSAWLASSWFLARGTDTPVSEVRARTALPLAAFSLCPLLFVPFFKGATPASDALPDAFSADPRLQLLIVLIGSIALTFGLLALDFERLRRGPVNFVLRHPLLTLIAMTITWIAVASFMDITRTHYLHGAGAPAVISDALTNINSGEGPLFSHYIQANGSSLLGLHSWLIWYLVYPLFRIWSSYYWLLIITKVAIGVAAIPIYLLARRFFSTGVGILLVLLYLLNRTVISQAGAGHISEQDFLPALFISTVYFWQVKRYLPFLLFGMLAMLVREDVGVMIALLGLLSAWKRYEARWWLVPTLAGTAWFVVMLFFLIPHMNPSGAFRPDVVYSDIGSDSGLLATLLFKPWVVIQQMLSTAQHFSTLYSLLASFGYGAFLLSPMFVIALPGILETLLLSQPNLSHYNSLMITAALMPSLIYGLVQVDRLSHRRWGRDAALAVVILSLCSTFSLNASWFTMKQLQPRHNYETALEILDRVPADASAIMPNYMIVRSGGNPNVRTYNQANYELVQEGAIDVEQDYVILDNEKIPAEWKNIDYYRGLLQLREDMASAPDFTLVVDRDDYLFYVRTAVLER